MKNFYFQIDHDLLKLFPKAQIGGLLLSNIQPLAEFKTELLDNAVANVLAGFLRISTNLESLQGITSWHKVFSLLGLKTRDFQPSHLALALRTKKNKELIRINPLVDIYNLFSLKNLIPVGGHDVKDISGITVGPTRGGEVYKPMNTVVEEHLVNEKEFAYLDNNRRILTRNLVWRQSEYSKVTENTSELFIPIDDFPGIKTPSQLEKIAAELLGLFNGFYSCDSEFKVINKFNNKTVYGDAANHTNIEPATAGILLAKPLVNNTPAAAQKFFDRKLDEIYPSREELEKALLSGQRLSFYFGADATAPKLHIGHIVPMLKLRQLQQLGHQIIILIGDFTGRIGDPTDKTAARVKLTQEEVMNNAASYKKQLSKYIDFDNPANPADFVFNSSWQEGLTFGDVIELASQFTIQQMLERDMFQERLKNNKPIYLHEFLYPLMQGYDSVFMQIDGEFGGRDQTFNMLAGRQLAKTMLGINKFVITTKFLLSADGVTKMSKSLGNCIFIEDTPEDKYGKVMAIPDSLIEHYLQLGTDLSDEQISDMSKKLKATENALGIKKQLAYEVVKLHDSEAAAQKAQAYFESTIQNKEIPINTKEVSRESLEKIAKEGRVALKDLIFALGLANSNADAKRLIMQGAVVIDGKKLTDSNTILELKAVSVINVGKLNWRKLV